MSEDFYKEVGKRLRLAREGVGMSQDELARQLNFTSSTTISYYESGERKISVADLRRAASILGRPVEYFLGDDPWSPELAHFQLRAQEVRPAARRSVADFLYLAHTHGSQRAELPEGISNLRPGQAADRLLAASEITEPPVDPRQVARFLKVPVYEWDFVDELAGIVVSDEGAVCIGVNSAHPRSRQNFTIGHEIGHLVYSRGEDLFLDFLSREAAWITDDKRQALETRANQLAADLLMPRSWVRSDVVQYGTDVTRLARRYEVSEEALWFRLMNLKLAGDKG